MELLYVWVEGYGNIKRQGFNFSPNYDINYDPDTKELKCEKKEMQQPKLFGDNISNITAIVGKNGSGKSTVLDFIKTFNPNIKSDEQIGFIVFRPKNGEIFYSKSEKMKISSSIKNENYNYGKYSIVFYSDFINELYRDTNSRINDISSENFINTWTEHEGYSQVTNYLYDDWYKQINFLRNKTEVIEKLPFKEYIEKLNSLNAIIVKFKEIDYEALYNDRTTDSSERKRLFKKLEDILLGDTGKNSRFVEKIIKSTLRYLIDRIVENIIQKKISEEDILNAIYSDSLNNEIDRQIKEINEKLVNYYYKNIEDDISQYEVLFDIKKKLNLKDNKIEEISKIIEKLNINREFIRSEFDKLNKDNSKKIDHLIKNIGESKDKYHEKYKNSTKFYPALTDLDLIDFEFIKELLNYKNLEDKLIIISGEAVYFTVTKENDIKIEFRNNGKNNKKFDLFFKEVEKGQRISKIINLGWSRHLSSGEYGLLKIMGRFNEVDLTLNGNYEDVLILLDEPEITFHPEWQRNMVAFLNSYFSEIYYKENKNKNIQIILTSHSPFVASDLPRENVIMLDVYDKDDIEVINKEQKEGNCKVVKDKDIKTFGANIFDLYKDSFFVNDIMGEFAKNKITKEIIEKLRTDNLTNEDFKNMEYIVNLIGDEVLSTILKNKIKDKRIVEGKRPVKDIINNFSPEEREEALKLLNMNKRSDNK